MSIPFLASRKSTFLQILSIGCMCISLLVTGCAEEHSSSTGTGSYAFTLVWPEDVPTREASSRSARAIDCDAAGVATVAATFYDANDNSLTSDEWPCSRHEGTIYGIPAGTNRRLVVSGKDSSGTVLYRAEKTEIEIVAGETKEGGEIEMLAVSSGLSDMTFELIPAGTFTMGSPISEPGRYDDETQHEVTLTKSFYLQTTEVTQGQWKAVMGDNPSRFSDCGDDCPVENVQWYDIQNFLEALNQMEGTETYRLPTEAEWEYACRAGSTTAFANGGITETECGYDPNLAAMGWYCGNSGEKTHPVAQKTPNAWGLYDMHGNVWEWCQDWDGDYPTGSVVDPQGPTTGKFRVLRGGSWRHVAGYCRSANRGRDSPFYKDHCRGFRLARDF